MASDEYHQSTLTPQIHSLGLSESSTDGAAAEAILTQVTELAKAV